MPEIVCKETNIKRDCILIFSCSCFLEKAVLGENPSANILSACSYPTGNFRALPVPLAGFGSYHFRDQDGQTGYFLAATALHHCSDTFDNIRVSI